MPPDVALACPAVHAVERNGQLAAFFRRHLGAHPSGGHGLDGAVHLEEDAAESRAVFFPHQAVDDGVEAAAGEGQAVGHGEEVRLSPEEGEGEVNDVEVDQGAPEREEVVGQPADAEGEHHHGNGSGHVGLPPAAAAPQVVTTEEAQQEQVGEGDDGVRQQEPQHHPQELVHPQPGRPLGETQQARRLIAAPKVCQLGENSSGRGGDGRRGPDEACGHLRGARSAAQRYAGFERRGNIAEAGQAHGRQEEAAGVDVEAREEAHGLAHGQTEGPAVVQRRVHSPKHQHHGEEQMGQSQVEHKEVDGARGDGVRRIQQEHHQHVHQHSRRGHHGVNHRHHDSHPQYSIIQELQLAFHAGQGPVESVEEQVGGVTGEARVATVGEVIEVLESPVGVGHVVAAKGIQHLLTMSSVITYKISTGSLFRS